MESVTPNWRFLQKNLRAGEFPGLVFPIINLDRKLQDRRVCLFSHGHYRKIRKRFIKLYDNLSWKRFIGLKAAATLLVDSLPYRLSQIPRKT